MHFKTLFSMVTCQLSQVKVIIILIFYLTYAMFFCFNYKKIVVVMSIKMALY